MWNPNEYLAWVLLCLGGGIGLALCGVALVIAAAKG